MKMGGSYGTAFRMQADASFRTVVFVLVVKPKLLQALENCCIFTSMLLLSTQSSEKRSSLTVDVLTFLLAVVATPLCALNLSWMP